MQQLDIDNVPKKIFFSTIMTEPHTGMDYGFVMRGTAEPMCVRILTGYTKNSPVFESNL
jgi:hypothetical protein